MIWNIKRATGICWEQLGYGCAEFERMEGNDIACEQCRVVQEIIDEGIPRFDNDADEHMVEFYAFLIRVASAGSTLRNPTLDRLW